MKSDTQKNNPILNKLTAVLFLSVAVFFIAQGCSEKSDKAKEIGATEQSDNSYYSWIEGLFQEITIDQFYVFSSFDFDNENFKFKGQRMTGEQLISFPEECWNPSTERTIYSACYKFKIDEFKMGLIIRAPGEYEQTSIQLALFDLKKDRVIDIVYLADVFGDAGETLNYSSYLFKNEKDNIQLLKYSHTSFQEIDGPEFTEDHSYHLLDVSSNWMDTISADSSYLMSKYPKMINQLTSL
ncbi:MAG: hypothetical protein ACJASQ_003887 [Crocinitomicaceae bacterium]|jgi:hypothetical protein